MYMNYISNPLLYKLLLVSTVAAFLSTALSFFLPSRDFSSQHEVAIKPQSSFNLTHAFSLESKIKIIQTKTLTKENAGEYLLTAFTLNSIFLNGEKSLVIIKNSKGGIFIRLHEKHLDYELIEVYAKKAKFKKGIHYYWSFLNPQDEKEFQENVALPSTSTGVITTMRETAARPMFEEIKFKDGQYYIPKDMLANPMAMTKYLGSAGAQMYNVNGAISFKMTYLPSHSVFYKLGLRKGDYIIEANGEKFKSMNDPIKFFQNIKNVKNLSLTVNRGNQNKELKYEVY
ncbi:hypothetical protein JHD48_06565 [Sulfurimonas sp. SAG-AH-194-I05]|nr:hypothetical protein [Sulfurimonas sp. SAG-AH-194-I05]MDF1875391.1 hypothetical protein [Sulfurimonas sp. SAG-AH-194-I05]